MLLLCTTHSQGLRLLFHCDVPPLVEFQLQAAFCLHHQGMGLVNCRHDSLSQSDCCDDAQPHRHEKHMNTNLLRTEAHRVTWLSCCAIKVYGCSFLSRLSVLDRNACSQMSKTCRTWERPLANQTAFMQLADRCGKHSWMRREAVIGSQLVSAAILSPLLMHYTVLYCTVLLTTSPAAPSAEAFIIWLQYQHFCVTPLLRETL